MIVPLSHHHCEHETIKRWYHETTTFPLTFYMKYLMSVLLPHLLGAIHFRGVNLIKFIWFKLTVWQTSMSVVFA